MITAVCIYDYLIDYASTSNLPTKEQDQMIMLITGFS